MIQPHKDIHPLQGRLALLRGITLLPLLIYPIVFMVDIMTLAAPGGGILNLASFVGISFVWVSLTYPITAIGTLMLNKRRSPMLAALPLFHLALAVVLCVLWYYLG